MDSSFKTAPVNNMTYNHKYANDTIHFSSSPAPSLPVLRLRRRTRSLAADEATSPLQRPALAALRVAAISRWRLPVLCFERSSKEWHEHSSKEWCSCGSATGQGAWRQIKTHRAGLSLSCASSAARSK